jgi:hypothetical protein
MSSKLAKIEQKFSQGGKAHVLQPRGRSSQMIRIGRMTPFAIIYSSGRKIERSGGPDAAGLKLRLCCEPFGRLGTNENRLQFVC